MILFKKCYYLIVGVLNRFKILRFVISGGTGAVVDLGLLFVLTDMLEIWYLVSAVVAFVVSFIVSFVLQKFWTFAEHSTNRMSAQITQYLIVALINLTINTAMVFVFVNYLGLHYILAQILTSAIIAVESYFLYKMIFRSVVQYTD